MIYSGASSYSLEALLPFVGLGFILGVFYDILRVLVLCFNDSKAIRAVADFIFVVITTLVTFMAFVGLNLGKLRFYSIACEALGAVIYFLGISYVFMEISKRIITILRRLIKKLFAPIRFLTVKICEKARLFINIIRKISKKHKINKKNTCNTHIK